MIGTNPSSHSREKEIHPMKALPWLALAAACSLTLALTLAALASMQSGGPGKFSFSILAKTTRSDDLGGASRFRTHLSTDKPIYREGEPVYVRAVLLDPIDGQPAPDGLMGRLEVRGPKGDVLTKGQAATEKGSIGFRWDIPQGQPGGLYKVRVDYPMAGGGYSPAEREIEIRAYRPPRLKTQITFVREGYGPDDRVRATCTVERAEGGIPKNAPVSVIARVDGEEVFRGSASVDHAGFCRADFPLPPRIERGEGSLLFVIEDGGVTETAAKTIPILLQSVDVAFYPEGGDLIAGLENRVYIEARLPNGKPADLHGVIVDGRGRRVTEIRTEHEGRGKARFTPRAGETYALRITSPSGIEKQPPLPMVRSEGAVLRASQKVYGADEPIRALVGATRDARWTLTLSKLEKELAAKRLEIAAGSWSKTTFRIPRHVDGVLRLTVWDEEDQPLAERLIFRQPAQRVRVALSLDKKRGVPGGEMALTLTTTNEKGEPVGAMVGLTVSDDAVRELLETREHAPRLDAMAYLEPEVLELADAAAYLDGGRLADTRLDLLLATQGWRRFAFADWQTFLAEQGDEALRALAFRREPNPISRVKKNDRKGWLLGERAREIVDAFKVGAAKEPHPAAFAPMAPAKPEPLEGADKGVADIGVADIGVEEKRKDVAFDDRANQPRRQIANGLVLAKEEAAVGEMEELLILADQDLAGFQNLAFRQYAHPPRPGRTPNARVDFTETLFWAAAIETDARTGTAQIRFALNDAVTSFRVMADAYTETGALGIADQVLESVKPFYAESKPPLHLTMGDRVWIPLSLVNQTENPLTGQYRALLDGREVAAASFRLKAHERGREGFPLQIAGLPGARELVIEVDAGAFADRVPRSFQVEPSGFPVEQAFGGILGPDQPLSFTLVVPERVTNNSLSVKTTLYPTPLASLTGALEALIRDPYGCFEQTSSTSYPLVMAQQYFTTHANVDPSLIARSREKLDKAYQRLTGFECDKKGFEWFGGDPGHEALTAYGLLQFTDMRSVFEVDTAMIARTRDWLLKRRNGKGGFERNPRALDSFGGAPAETTDAYITWALTESGEVDLRTELNSLREVARVSEDSYILALAANALHASGDRAEGIQIMQRLGAKQVESGLVEGAATSITRSGGENLSIETTALALLAWMREDRFAANVERGMRYLAESCKAGRFGATQSTVLALRAIIAYDRAHAKPKAPGSVQLFLEDDPLGAPLAFGDQTQGTLDLPDFSSQLGPGHHRVRLEMRGGAAMPVSLSLRARTPRPDSSEACKLEHAVRLTETRLAEGEATELMVRITNRSEEVVPTPVAILGLPGGLEPRHDQLKELVKAGTLDAYEIKGRELICYWRYLPAGKTLRFPISCIAAAPGTYTAPASRVYEYYNDEHKHWSAGPLAQISSR